MDAQPIARLRRHAPLAVLLALGALGAGLHLTGLVHIEPSEIVAVVRAAGPFGAFALIALFVLGTIANLPGVLFVGAAVAVYGACTGYFVALVGAILSVTAAFALGRRLGLGRDTTLRRPWQQRLLARLDAHPIAIIALLRTVVVVSPPVSYALALTRLRLRDYALGSALGLVIPIWVIVQGAQLLL
ncbi:MAG: VTT domain-containing protein [Polyangiaceae bacterium]